MPKKRQTHIECLFAAINGGDDVDSAALAQEIATGLLAALKEALYDLEGLTGGELESGGAAATVTKIKAAIRKAEGRPQ